MKKIILTIFIFVGFASGALAYKFLHSTHDALGVIVNHHLLAPQLLQQGLAELATQEPRIIILISPNHFSRGHYPIIMSQRDWEVPGDHTFISKLAATKLAYVEEMPFEKEHGIYNITPYIAQVIPHVRIVPIIVKDSATDEQIDALAKEIIKTAPRGTRVVGSFDFSHNLPTPVAQFHDMQSMSVLRAFDFAGLKKIDTDSRPGIRLVLKIMEGQNARGVDILANTNSGLLMQDPNYLDTTSYVIPRFVQDDSRGDGNATVLASVLPLPENMPRFSYGQDLNLLGAGGVSTSTVIRGVTIAVIYPHGAQTLQEIAAYKQQGAKIIVYGGDDRPAEYRRAGASIVLLTQKNASSLSDKIISIQTTAVGLVFTADSDKLGVYLFPLEARVTKSVWPDSAKRAILLRRIADSASGTAPLTFQIINGYIEL